MKKLPLALLLLCLAQPVLAQGWTNIFRSISSSLGGSGEKSASGSNATVGVRGMDEEAAQAAPPASEDVKIVDGWAASKPEAEAAAAKRGLTANSRASYGETTPATPTATTADTAPGESP